MVLYWWCRVLCEMEMNAGYKKVAGIDPEDGLPGSAFTQYRSHRSYLLPFKGKPYLPLAAEKSPFPGWGASTMYNDRWMNPMEDNNDACVFTQCWILPPGGPAASPPPAARQ